MIALKDERATVRRFRWMPAALNRGAFADTLDER
jgi:hypothetical protein